MRPLTFGTRGSSLARWQTDSIIRQLRAAWPALDCQTKIFTTSGDRIIDKPLPEIGGKGLFTEELESALRSGEIDVAVHSLKDLPIEAAPDLVLGSIGERADARDVLISREGRSLAALPPAPAPRLPTCATNSPPSARTPSFSRPLKSRR